MQYPKLASELDAQQRRATAGVVLAILDRREHFGGCTTCEVAGALIDASRRLGYVASVDLTLQILEAMRKSGKVEKIEGKVVTTWKVKHESG